MDVDTPFLDGPNQRLTSGRRRAEICYILHRGDPRAGVLLHRKIFYPSGAFRLPTGGVHEGEAVLDTLVREIEEETSFRLDLSLFSQSRDEREGSGIPVTLQAFLGTLEYGLDHRSQRRTHHFATYHFLVAAPADAVPVPLDPGEQVAGWQWRSIDEMGAVADRLGTVGAKAPAWGDWGRFRALSHRFVAAVIGGLNEMPPGDAVE